MSDTREAILVQLETLLGNISGVATVCRNRDSLPTDKLPGIVLLDGREESAMLVGNTRNAKMPPALFTLWPQIWLSTRLRDTNTNDTLDGQYAPIGPEVSAYRMLILDAVCNDPTLLSIVTDNGMVEYKGCETDMAIGSTMRGNLMMQFAIRYVLVPPRG